MPQIHNLPSRIPEGNYREAELLNRGFMENVFETRQRLIKRNQRAKTIKEAMRSNPNMFGPNGAQVDTFGGEDIDIRKARVQDDSRMQGPSSSAIQNDVLVEPMDVLNRPSAGKDAVMNIYNKQANRMGTMYNQNNSIPDTISLLGANAYRPTGVLGIGGNLQESLVNQGIKNQQQIMGQDVNTPLGAGTVLRNEEPKPATPLPINSRVSASTSEGGSAGSTSSENYRVSADYKGASAEGILGTTTRVDQRTNMIDPVQKNMDDLNTLAILGSTNFQGEVHPANNIDLLNKNKKEAYLTSLNEQMSKEGTFETQEREKFKVEDKGMSGDFQDGMSSSSNITSNIRTTGSSAIQNPSGGKPDYNGSLFVRGSNGKIVQVEYDGDPKDPNTLMKTDFTNSGSIAFLNPDFSGMSRDNEGNFVVAKDPGEAMRNGLKFIKPQLENTVYSLEGPDGNRIMKVINGRKEQIGWLTNQPVGGGYALSVKPLKGKWRVEDNTKFNLSGTADEVKQGTGFNAGAQMDNN